MSTEMFKLDIGQPETRTCSNCAFSNLERVPQQLISQLVCHEGPPQAVAVPAPNGYQVLFMSPIVRPQLFCHRHKPLAIVAAPNPEKLESSGQS